MFYVLTVIGLSVFANDCIGGLLCRSYKVAVLLLFFVYLSKALYRYCRRFVYLWGGSAII